MTDKKILNIFFVTSEFLNNDFDGIIDGGIANEYYKFAIYLTALGHKVSVVDVSGKNYKKVIYNGVTIYKFNPRGYFKIIKYIPESISYALKKPNIDFRQYLYYTGIKWFLFIQAIKGKIDIIQYTSELELGLCPLKNTPSCIRIASYNKNILEEYGHEVDKSTLYKERKMYENHNFITGPSEYIANMILQDLNLERNVEIIETPFLKSTNETDNLYYDKIKEKKYILFFGTLGLLKGSFDIAEIIYDLLDKHKDICLVMVGKQVPYEEKLPYDVISSNAKEYSNRVIWFDKMQHKYLYPIIQNAELCIMPSRTENFSNTCLEAMHFKRIVIGTTPFFNQIIEDGKTGFLCEPKNPKSLLSKIEQVLNLTKQEKEIIQNNAYERVCKCSPEKMTEQLLGFYRKVIKSWGS